MAPHLVLVKPEPPPMVAYRNLCEYRWAITQGDQPYVKLRSKRSGLMASIMFFPKLGERVNPNDFGWSTTATPPSTPAWFEPERTGLWVVRHFHGPPWDDKQQRNEFRTLEEAWKFARRMIA